MKGLFAVLGGFALAVGMAGCGGGGSSSSMPENQPPAVNLTGTWSGSVTSSVTGTRTASLNLTQNGAAVTGNYSTNGGQLGTVAGTVSGYSLACTITPTQAGCSGSLGGGGTVSGNTLSFSYSGTTSCGGPETGYGNLVKQ